MQLWQYGDGSPCRRACQVTEIPALWRWERELSRRALEEGGRERERAMEREREGDRGAEKILSMDISCIDTSSEDFFIMTTH